MPAPSRYTPGPIPGLSRETVAALYAEFRRLSDDLQTQSRPDAVIPLQQDRLQAAAGQFLRVSPPAEGMVLTLPAPDPTNMGERNAVTVFIELPYGPLDIAATPKVNPDRSVTAATVNGSAMARFTVAGVVRFFSNGLDQWQSTSSLPIAVDEQGNVAIPTPGPTVATGATGPQGAKGAIGPSGLDGQPGLDGVDGFPGLQGAQGPQGLMGLWGSDGVDGNDGFPGTPGSAGADGVAGAQGLMGFSGNDGVDGQDGFPGLPGATGPQGPAGSSSGGGPSFQGNDGNDGQDGTTWVQTVILPASTSGAVGSVTVNLGTVALWSGSFDITGLSGLTINANIFVARAVDTVDPTEAEEQVTLSGIVISSTTIRVHWEGVNSPLNGSLKVMYLLPDVTLAATPTVSPGQQLGLQIDAAGPGTAIALTGPEQGENIRHNTVVSATISGTVNNWNPTGWGDTTTKLAITLSADVTLTGLDASVLSVPAGKEVEVEVTGGAFSLIVSHDGGTSTLGNRFSCVAYIANVYKAGDRFIIRRDEFSYWAVLSASVDTNRIQNDAVTNAKLANMTDGTVKLRAAGAGTGDPTDTAIDTAFQRCIRVDTLLGSDASYTVTPPTGATWWRARFKGGGGGGGGADADTNGEASAASGGGEGGECELWYPIVSGNITGAVAAIAAGGINIGGDGTAGNSTTVTYNGETYAALGGVGGVGVSTGPGQIPATTSAGAALGGAGNTATGASNTGHIFFGFWAGQSGGSSFMYGVPATVANCAAMGGAGGGRGGGKGGLAHQAATGLNGVGGLLGGGGGGAAIIASGATTGFTGGDGGTGWLIIEFFSGPVPTRSPIS